MNGLATGVPDLNTPELIAAMASSTSSSTQNTDELSETGLSSGMDLVNKIGSNFGDQITDIDQETADGITQSGLGGVANILIVSFFIHAFLRSPHDCLFQRRGRIFPII